MSGSFLQASQIVVCIELSQLTLALEAHKLEASILGIKPTLGIEVLEGVRSAVFWGESSDALRTPCIIGHLFGGTDIIMDVLVGYHQGVDYVNTSRVKLLGSDCH